MDNPAFLVELENEKDPQTNGVPAKLTHTFNEAVTLTQIGKFHYLLLLICGFCFWAVTVETMGISFLMPFLLCDLNSTVSEQGILASAGFLGVVLGSHAAGFFADTWGRVRTLRYALTLGFLASFISAFSVNTWMLIVFRFLNGFFIAGCQACVFSLCGEFHGDGTRVRFVTMTSIFLPISLVYMPVAGILILPLRIEASIFGMTLSSWRIMLIVNSILSLLAWAGLQTLPETPKYVLVQGNPEEALEILRYMFTKNTSKTVEEYPVQSLQLESTGSSLTNIRGPMDALKLIWNQSVPLFARERYLHTINICFLLFVIYFISQGTFMWFPTMLNVLLDRKDDGLKVCEIIDTIEPDNEVTSNVCAGELDLFVYYMMMVGGACFTLIYLIFTFTIDKVGKKNLLMCSMSVTIICCVTIQWTDALTPTFAQLVLIMGVANCGGIVSTISVEFFPTNVNAMGMCFIMMVGRLGAVIGSNVIGQLIFNSCDNVFWAFTAALCITVLCSCTLPERKKVKKAT